MPQNRGWVRDEILVDSRLHQSVALQAIMLKGKCQVLLTFSLDNGFTTIKYSDLVAAPCFPSGSYGMSFGSHHAFILFDSSPDICCSDLRIVTLSGIILLYAIPKPEVRKCRRGRFRLAYFVPSRQRCSHTRADFVMGMYTAQNFRALLSALSY